jgi:Rrf2 family protein
MLKINKKVEYALMVLAYITTRDPTPKRSDSYLHLFTAREIGEAMNIPFDPLSKVMQTLAHMGVLKSSQGLKGGYILQGNLQALSFYELNFVLEGETFGDYCNGPKGQCQQFSTCNIIHPLLELNTQLINFFKTVSIAQLLKLPTPLPQELNPEDLNQRTIL